MTACLETIASSTMQLAYRVAIDSLIGEQNQIAVDHHANRKLGYFDLEQKTVQPIDNPGAYAIPQGSQAADCGIVQ